MKHDFSIVYPSFPLKIIVFDSVVDRKRGEMRKIGSPLNTSYKRCKSVLWGEFIVVTVDQQKIKSLERLCKNKL